MKHFEDNSSIEDFKENPKTLSNQNLLSSDDSVTIWCASNYQYMDKKNKTYEEEEHKFGTKMVSDNIYE